MSTFKPRSELQRKTASTHNTAKNLRHLIATLRNRPMEMDAVSFLLACAPSTSRKYLNQLLDAKCIVVDHLLPKLERAHAGRAVYALTDDQELVQNFLAMVDSNDVPPPAPRRTLLEKATPGRHFHILGDDEPTQSKTKMRPAFRDWAVEALFGPAGAAA